LIAFCRDWLAAFKVPIAIEFRSELPRNIVGKLLRRQLREEEINKMHTEALHLSREDEAVRIGS
jgi:long-chain acyl-CoA synthetase